MKEKARKLTPRSLIRKMVIAARDRKTTTAARPNMDVTTAVISSAS